MINRVELVYLTTINLDGYPSTRAMLNLRNKNQFPQLVSFMSQFDENLTLFFTTNRSTAKVIDIINNSKGSAYFCDIVSKQGFLVQGEIEVVDDNAIKEAIWLDDWFTYFPEGIESVDFTILRLNAKNI
ncbi:MAG: hypothetical protein EHM93_20035 [Bacteroidales bacterium]|nr:MAG: hypothetical protein EHM93_20035 [Bacteroidales bacterium]